MDLLGYKNVSVGYGQLQLHATLSGGNKQYKGDQRAGVNRECTHGEPFSFARALEIWTTPLSGLGLSD